MCGTDLPTWPAAMAGRRWSSRAGRSGRPVRDELPVTSVWLTCQRPAREQRRGRYVAQTSRHPAKMLPDAAAHAIAAYTAPGELVGDPMSGSGTTLVEAVRSGRDAIGVD